MCICLFHERYLRLFQIISKLESEHGGKGRKQHKTFVAISKTIIETSYSKYIVFNEHRFPGISVLRFNKREPVNYGIVEILGEVK